MAVSGTNQSKTIVSPYNTVKTRNAQAIYGMGIYGIAVYGVGVPSGIPTNQDKSGGATTFLVTDEGDFLITDEGDFLCGVIGGSVTNQAKS